MILVRLFILRVLGLANDGLYDKIVDGDLLLWRICDKRFDNLTITSEDFDHERRIV